MKISSINGILTINGKEVLTVIFTDGSSMRFPTDDANEIVLEGSAAASAATVFGSRNTVISGKNIIAPGSVINTKGDFRIGDG